MAMYLYTWSRGGECERQMRSEIGIDHHTGDYVPTVLEQRISSLTSKRLL